MLIRLEQNCTLCFSFKIIIVLFSVLFNKFKYIWLVVSVVMVDRWGICDGLIGYIWCVDGVDMVSIWVGSWGRYGR